jgi:HD-GYP domain-containing protein (c-di-GMP phosphodiesterase class II)
MTSHRHYRSQLSLEEAILQLREGAGTQFDSRVVDMLLELLSQDALLRQNAESDNFLR